METKVIGITGTNGKTTTKELIAAVLSQSYNVLYTLGNLNNHIGVPLTLLRLTKAHDFAIIEMGANHPGEIKTLATIADPDYGIITNVGKAHLEGFGSFEGVIRTKGELYDYLRTKGNTSVFIWDDNPYLRNMASDIPQIAYGTEGSLYINGRITANSTYLTFEWKNSNERLPYQVQTRLIGAYNLPNALAAVTIGFFFGVKPEKINEALEAYTPQNNRSQLKKTESNTLIIDAYNANPTSMAAALENFKNMSAPHKVVILGDMRELGTESAAEHQKIIDYINTCHFEQVFLVGENFAATKHTYISYANAQELIAAFQTSLRPTGKTILIKGSNGMKLGQVVEFLSY
ncbi:UDP-N-acetylmuramoyl-tripeptide--D-alanyl-D-alanine ligase, partial [termite gut metagenome]